MTFWPVAGLWIHLHVLHKQSTSKVKSDADTSARVEKTSEGRLKLCLHPFVFFSLVPTNVFASLVWTGL